MLSSARESAAQEIRKAQVKYKKYHDRNINKLDYQVREWILIRFPAEETEK